MIMLFIFFISLMFMFLNHPLSMGLMLLLQTICISILSGIMMINFWYSYMIFLIMIGGMLVLFLYMTNVASNEKFKFSIKLMLQFYIFLILLIFIKLLNVKYNFKLTKMIMTIDNYFELTQTMTKFLNFPMNMIYIMMIIYLFITLIAIVKITNIKYGPLRQMN